MRKGAFLAVCTLLLAVTNISISNAANKSCTSIGNSSYCSDGYQTTRIGNTTYDNRGNSYTKIGNSTYGSNGYQSTKIGNSTYDNRGNSYTKIGNTTYGSNGSSCTKIGRTTYCSGR